MSFQNIIKFTSIVGILIFATLLAPPLIGLLYGEQVLAYLICMFVLLLVNLGIFVSLKDHDLSLSIKDSIISVNLIWILLGIAGAIPFVMMDALSVTDALFEAVSGFTTTGATVIVDIESLPKSLLFHRGLMHWIGGMGIIVLGVGLLPLLSPNASLSLFKAESTGISIDKISPKIKDTAIKLWKIYLIFTLCDFILLMLFGMNWIDALNHAFSTIATGGFSTKNSSLGFYQNGLIIWTTIIFMYLSSINFLAHIRFSMGDRKSYFNEEVIWFSTIILLLTSTLSLYLYYQNTDSFYTSLTHAAFCVVSIATTTGFVTQDYEAWGNVAVMILFFAMILGGNSGSTSGGFKTIRHIIVIKNIFYEIKRVLQPDNISSLYINDQELKNTTLRSVFGFLSLFIVTILFTMAYLYARGYDEMTSLSAAIATVGNVGPGFGLIGPSENYSFFSGFDKIFLSIAMIIGRLECYTFFMIFSLSFWKRF